ncbi:MAG TPA: NAD(P)H-dependent oxidoreductase subunit E [Acidimicrobiales bacterium]|nr:NAD(P)H-dependent oxidoreductase subunit E [Acidimicrobiales bacterium]
MAPLNEESLARARAVVALYPERRSALIPLCHLAQAQEGWLTPEAMEQIAELVDVTAAEVRGTASFYDMLHLEPIGRHLVAVCTNIACLLAGGYELLEHAEEHLGIRAGQTTDDGEFTLEEVECLAACDVAPCVQVNHRFFGPLDDDAFDRLVEGLRSGALAGDVPRHGVLCRVERAVGLLARTGDGGPAPAVEETPVEPPARRATRKRS